MKFFYTLILISLSISAEPIKVDKAELEKFDCSYKNADYESRNDINPERVTHSQALMDKITEHEEEIYGYLKAKISDYHYYSEELGYTPGYYLNKYFFEYQGDKITVYRSAHDGKEKTIGFCFEGKFSNELVKNFFNVEEIEKIEMNGNGEFYLLSDAYSMVKFYKSNDLVKYMYIYSGYD